LLSDIIACHEAVVPDFADVLRPGEERFIIIVSVRLDSAVLHIRNIAKMLKHTKSLGRLIRKQKDDRIELANDVVIVSLPASGRAGRGYTASLVVFDELAHFMDSDGNASGDSVFDAFMPTLATFGERGRAVVTTTPAARQGIVYELFDKALPDWYITRKATTELNPKVSVKTIERARLRDAESAATEYDAEFREPVQAFLSSDAIDAAVNHSRSRVEVGQAGVSYFMGLTRRHWATGMLLS